MADVSDRAQLILVSGLMIAVTLLVLVLLLNTVIYTENVATRGIDSDLGEASAFQLVMDEEIERLLEREHENGADGGEVLEERVSSSIEVIGDQQAKLALLRGHVTTVDAEFTRGVVIDDDEFTDALVNDVDDLKTFVLDIDADTLATDDSIDVIAGDWQLSITKDESSLTIEDDADSCSTESNEVAIDFVEGTVKPEAEITGDCPAFFDPDGTPPDATGPFDLEISGDTGEGIVIEVHAVGSDLTSDQETATWHIHRADLTLTYRSPQIDFETVREVFGAPP